MQEESRLWGKRVKRLQKDLGTIGVRKKNSWGMFPAHWKGVVHGAPEGPIAKGRKEPTKSLES